MHNTPCLLCHYTTDQTSSAVQGPCQCSAQCLTHTHTQQPLCRAVSPRANGGHEDTTPPPRCQQCNLLEAAPTSASGDPQDHHTGSHPVSKVTKPDWLPPAAAPPHCYAFTASWADGAASASEGTRMLQPHAQQASMCPQHTTTLAVMPHLLAATTP